MKDDDMTDDDPTGAGAVLAYCAGGPRPLRADAAQNRARILAAATTLFAERGLEVSLDDIAAEAGLGVGTVYRRFSGREALIDALFEDRMRAASVRARAALADPDPGRGLRTFLEDTCQEIVADRGLSEAFLTTVHGRERMVRKRAELGPLLAELVARAEATGAVRQGVAGPDVPVLFLMMGAVAQFTHQLEPDAWRRYLQLLLDGLRPQPDSAPLPAGALTPAELEVAMSRFRSRTVHRDGS